MIHTGERPFPCDYCSAKFTRRSNLKNHLLNVHRDLRGVVTQHKKAPPKQGPPIHIHLPLPLDPLKTEQDDEQYNQ